MKHAIRQTRHLALEDETNQYIVINMHKSMYRYNLLCFGLSPTPAIFQKLVDYLVAGISGVATNYLDDIMILAGQTKSENLDNLRRILEALDKYGMLELDKCVFFVAEMPYLGFIISKAGW